MLFKSQHASLLPTVSGYKKALFARREKTVACLAVVVVMVLVVVVVMVVVVEVVGKALEAQTNLVVV